MGNISVLTKLALEKNIKSKGFYISLGLGVIITILSYILGDQKLSAVMTAAKLSAILYIIYVLSARILSEDLINGTIQHTIASNYSSKDIIVSSVLAGTIIISIQSIVYSLILIGFFQTAVLNLTIIKFIAGLILPGMSYLSIATFINALIKDASFSQKIIYAIPFISSMILSILSGILPPMPSLSVLGKLLYPLLIVTLTGQESVLIDFWVYILWVIGLIPITIKLFNRKEF